MSIKRKVVYAMVYFTDGINKEIHDAIELKVTNAYREQFPSNENSTHEEIQQRKSDMRAFYYHRMSMTGTFLFAITGIVVMVAQLLISLFS